MALITPPENVQEAFSKAMVLLMTSPEVVFFTHVCLALHHQWDDEIPTACCNGTRILYNPDFFMSLAPEARTFLILHETLHAAYLHSERAELMESSPQRWNAAADYVINAQLIKAGFKMPKGGLYNRKYGDKSTEEVYALLPESQELPQELCDLAPATGDADPSQAMETILLQAYAQAELSEDFGNIPGQLERYIQDLRNPKLPWYSILHRYMQAMVKTNYTWRKPNRRYFPDHYLPSTSSETMTEMATIIDTSGSVSEEEFTDTLAEVKGIFHQLQPKKTTLVQFDHEIKGATPIDRFGDLLRVKFTGGGGTRIDPVMRWITKNNPTIAVIFTDGFFHTPTIKPKSQVIWIIYGNPSFTVPFGKIIHYNN